MDRTGHMCEGVSLWQWSLKHKRKKIISDNGIKEFPSVADKSSDGPGGYSSLSVQFPGVICVGQEIIMS